jgi:hypothetical protein
MTTTRTRGGSHGEGGGGKGGGEGGGEGGGGEGGGNGGGGDRAGFGSASRFSTSPLGFGTVLARF